MNRDTVLKVLAPAFEDEIARVEGRHQTDGAVYTNGVIAGLSKGQEIAARALHDAIEAEGDAPAAEPGDPWVLVRNGGGNVGMYWRANHSGYTQSIHAAGHYTREEAELIAKDGNSIAYRLADRIAMLEAALAAASPLPAPPNDEGDRP